MNNSDSTNGEFFLLKLEKKSITRNCLDASHKKTNYANFIDHHYYSNVASGCGKGLCFSLHDIRKDVETQTLVLLTEQD